MDILLYALQPSQINSKLVFWIYFKKQTNFKISLIYSGTKPNKYLKLISLITHEAQPNKLKTSFHKLL